MAPQSAGNQDAPARRPSGTTAAAVTGAGAAGVNQTLEAQQRDGADPEDTALDVAEPPGQLGAQEIDAWLNTDTLLLDADAMQLEGTAIEVEEDSDDEPLDPAAALACTIEDSLAQLAVGAPEQLEVDDAQAEDCGWKQAPDSEWLGVRRKPVDDRDPDGMCVYQAAVYELEAVSKGKTLAQAERDIRVTATRHRPGLPGPRNPHNRYPPSIYVCQVIVGVPSLEGKLRGVCPNGCVYEFPQRSKAWCKEHAAQCTGCHLCLCLICQKGARFKDKSGEHALYCYLLDDVVQTMIFDKSWLAAFDRSQAEQLFQSDPWPEAVRLRTSLQGLGYSLDQVRLACSMCCCPCAECCWPCA
jgi:hypothetical protein